MTCPGCGRQVTLVGGICGHCSTDIAVAVGDALDSLSLDVELDVRAVDKYQDGDIHVRLFEPGPISNDAASFDD